MRLMHFEKPDPDDYSRATNTERFEAVIKAARSRLDELAAKYVVAVEPGTVEEDFPGWAGTAAVEVVRLRPDIGVPVSVLFTEFPGVSIRIGQWGNETLPHCGCDACNDQPEELIERLDEIFDAVVAGGYAEELTKKSLRTSLASSKGTTSSRGPLSRGEWRKLGELGSWNWPAWLPQEQPSE